MGDAWEQIKSWLSVKLSEGAYQNWISQTTLGSLRDGELTVRVPNDTAEAWIREEYTGQIRAAIQELNLPVRHVRYEVATLSIAAAAGYESSAGHGSNGGGRTKDQQLFESTANWLNPRLTFDSYVVGASNQLAHAAARAVAKTPSRSYNPLFIYGGVGIGKTHLMHAIGRALLDSFAGLNVVYTSSERFMNEMITSIKLDRMPLFPPALPIGGRAAD